MGGMAIGSCVCSRLSHKWKNLLLVYAIVEAVLGCIALLFHPLFDTSLHFAYTLVIPNLQSPLQITTFKFLLATLLILPQSILLGMTFPLMSAGVLRHFPHNSGRSLATLYFCNSFGAAIGVLVCGFLLLRTVGLPGSIATAGSINLLLALSVWFLCKNDPHYPFLPQFGREAQSELSKKKINLYFPLLMLSFCTGTASFIYELSWIRMLSMVLSSSTHAFELMLSAFIFGLAMGGLWIRSKIESIRQPIFYLGLIQLIMGLLALSTIPLYNLTFEVMQWLYHTLDRTDAGYFWFNTASHGIALAVMLPTTFCAGMTLPLITSVLLRQGHGEKSIGSVYACNTVGALLGIGFAIHLGMPYLGLKGLLCVGAALDIGVALFLFFLLKEYKGRKPVFAAGAIGAGALLFGLLLAKLDFYKMSSSVYRSGILYSQQVAELLYHKDGKTSTVTLQRIGPSVNIRTNGKIDAAINSQRVGSDEPTMVLAGAIPLVLHPDAKNAAVVGLGSGLTSHTLLCSSALDEVDTIEIEQAIVKAARGFMPRVARAYSDPRSRIHIDDAKSFFSTQQKKYDIIISEPSNPWVSGVADLFTKEYYATLPNFLNDQGIYVQWLQLYEFNMDLVATIMKALSPHFDDYALYMATGGDLLVVARKGGKLDKHSDRLFSYAPMRKELQWIGVHTLGDITVRRLGAKEVFEPLFQSFTIRANSDYYPILDLSAAKARFLGETADYLSRLNYSSLPVARLLDDFDQGRSKSLPIHAVQHNSREIGNLMSGKIARVMRDCYYSCDLDEAPLTDTHKRILTDFNRYFKQCEKTNANRWIAALLNFSNSILAHLTISELDAIWQDLEKGDCYDELLPEQQDWLALMHSISLRDGFKTEGLASWLLSHNIAGSKRQFGFLVAAAMLGEIMQQQPEKARVIFEKYKEHIDLRNNPDYRLLLSFF